MDKQKYLCDRCARYPCSENETKLMTLCPAYSPKPKPTTNADHIRSMSDEELAAKFCTWFCRICDRCPIAYYCGQIVDRAKTCGDVWLDWLQSEVEGGDHDA